MINEKPTQDGAITEYVSANAVASGWFDPDKSVIFVNGMLNGPEHHRDSALALSFLQMCKVVGIYNQSRRSDVRWFSKTRAVIEDLAQCIGDKMTWDSHGIDRAAANLHTWYQSHFGTAEEARRHVEIWLAPNPAALSLFRHLMKNRTRPQTIFAHSQGNLITSNALTAMYLLDKRLVKNITVNSYASPAVFWPEGFTHIRYAYTVDFVPLLFGVGNSLSFKTSTIGGPMGVFSHAFTKYLADDATFVVNRYRIGMLRMTAHMDEEGLAKALYEMGANMERIYAIFQRLDDAHRTDVDDIALLYIEKIRHRPDLVMAIRHHRKLRTLLVRALDEGWTTDREKAAIEIISPDVSKFKRSYIA